MASPAPSQNRKFFAKGSDERGYAAAHARLQLHHTFNETATLRTCYESDPLVGGEQSRLAFLGVISRQTFKKPADGHAEEGRDFKEHRRADTVFAVFILLELLGTDPDSAGKLSLRYVGLNADGSDLMSHIKISRVWSLARAILPVTRAQWPFGLRNLSVLHRSRPVE